MAFRLGPKPLIILVPSIILLGGLIASAIAYRQRSGVEQVAAARLERITKVAQVMGQIWNTFDNEINRITREGHYCAPRCAPAYRTPDPMHRVKFAPSNSWEIVTTPAALRVLSIPELDSAGQPQLRLVISYATIRPDANLGAAMAPLGQLARTIMQRLAYPAAYVDGQCLPSAATARSSYSCEQHSFIFFDGSYDPIAHPQVRLFRTERTITMIRKGPFSPGDESWRTDS